ncbi:MAG TPA: PEP-CTERM sorting domain-containing protein [Rhodocyclaceae bacterium]|nr:PEP-CTERM sorting domain-containing protein [Rhodocyclaceae bacterium]
MAGVAVFGTIDSAVAAAITSVSRNVVATDNTGPDNTASGDSGPFSADAWRFSPDGLPPVSAAGQLSTIRTLNQGASLVVNAGGDQGGWAQLDAHVFRPGGSASASLLLNFTVDTNANWDWIGGVVQDSPGYASVAFSDVTAGDLLFALTASGPTQHLVGSLLAGHKYLFSIFSSAGYDPNIEGGAGSLVEGLFRVDENFVPEPSTLTLLGLVVALLGMTRRKKRA